MKTVIKSAAGIVVLGMTIGLGWFLFGTRSEAPPRSLSSTSPTEPAPASAKYTLVAFGDSLTAGYGLPVDESYPALLERMLLTRGASIRVINSGVSGETSAGGVRRAAFVRSLNPDIVLFGLGGNDALRFLSPQDLEKNLDEALGILLAGTDAPQVLLLGMRAPGNADAEYRRAFDAVYPRLAEKYQLPLVPFFLEGVALDRTYTIEDGIHPNALGYAFIIEKNILPILWPLLENFH